MLSAPCAIFLCISRVPQDIHPDPGAGATVLVAAQSASGATPLTVEVLGGTGKTSNTTYSQCRYTPGASASFSVSGDATGNGTAGQYPGTLLASGRAWASGRQQFGFAYGQKAPHLRSRQAPRRLPARSSRAGQWRSQLLVLIRASPPKPLAAIGAIFK
jgi:hypothetical protein